MFESIDTWNFSKKILHSQGLTLLNFWTPWSAECHRMSIVLDETVSNVGKEIQILKIDWDAQRRLADELEVYGVPTLLIFNNGKLIRRYSGVLTVEELQHIIKKSCKTDFASKGVKNL